MGHRPEEFRSLGRLSASELCSLPMVPAARAAEERLPQQGDRARAGTGAGMLQRVWTPPRAAACGRCGSPRRGAGGGEPGASLWEPTRNEARPGGAPHARLFWRNPKARETGHARLQPPLPPAGGAALTRRRRAGSFRDAERRRRQFAAVSSGLGSHRLSQRDGRGDSGRKLGRRLLKGPTA